MKRIQPTLYIYAETPMHVGTGTGLGAVDMPIQREKHTAYPLIQASGVKGALRDTAELYLGRDSQEVKSIFGGVSGSDDGTHVGAISPSDARILCFPVRALNGVFVWISSPLVLERYQLETGAGEIAQIPSSSGALLADSKLLLGDKVMFEEFAYEARQDKASLLWSQHLAAQVFPDDKFWQDRMTSHFAILPDEEFRDFVRYSTEIVTRIHIDDKKTVKDGQLFTQELLPADSLLYSVVQITNSRDKKYEAVQVLEGITTAIGSRIQIGGDETVGRGRVRLSWQNDL
jgi:CRISPR-associated protein Cmr4